MKGFDRYLLESVLAPWPLELQRKRRSRRRRLLDGIRILLGLDIETGWEWGLPDTIKVQLDEGDDHDPV